MSHKVQIIANDEPLELYKDFDKKFWISLVIHDLSDLESRNASFSKSFTIPGTSNNISILGPEISVFNIPNPSGIKKIPCKVLMGGVTVLSKGNLIITNVKGKYDELELELLWGNYDFFNVVKQFNINEIDYSDLDMTWDISGVTAIAENTEGIVFAGSEWQNYEDMIALGSSMPIQVRNATDIRLAGFWIYTKELLNRIVIEAGYVMDDSLVSWDNWATAAIACPADRWVDIEPKIGGYSGNIAKANTEILTDVGQVVPIEFDGTIIDPDSQWAGTPSWAWDIDTGVPITRVILFKAVLNIIETQRNPSDVPYVAIQLNGVNQDIHNFIGDETDVITLENKIIVSTGDIIRCVAFASDGTGSNGSTIEILESGTVFEMEEEGNSDPDDTLEVSKYIPDMTASKFVTSLCNMANVIPYTLEAIKTIQFISFDNVIKSEQYDWSSRLVLNKSISSTNIIKGYFQNNEFNYATNGPIARTDTNGSRTFRDELLDARGTIIQLDFDACDKATYQGSGRCTAGYYGVERESATGISVGSGLSTFITTNTEEWNIGDYIEVNTSGATHEVLRIIAKVSDTQGTVEGTWNTTFSDSTKQYFFHRNTKGDSSVVRVANIDQDNAFPTQAIVDGAFNSGSTSIDSFIAQFDTDMTFQFLIDTEYEELLSVLDPPLIIQAWFTFTTAEFTALELNRLVYINYFDTIFYINKLDQYKADHPVRVELVRAKSL